MSVVERISLHSITVQSSLALRPIALGGVGEWALNVGAVSPRLPVLAAARVLGRNSELMFSGERSARGSRTCKRQSRAGRAIRASRRSSKMGMDRMGVVVLDQKR